MKPIVKSSAEVKASSIAAGTGASTQVLLGPDDGMPHFAMRKFSMLDGGGMPFHTNTVEHEQYVLSGRARIRIGDEDHEVGPEDVLYIPAGVAHSYSVIEGPFEFLCMVPNLPDKLEILDAESDP
ncbi:MAG: cupin domain-containing protein [bacterium]|nr:cupin domain-containing protein [bacterium]